MNTPRVFDASGPVQLGNLLGKGGEGAVYEVANRPDTVAKIYLGAISTERADKLAVMRSLRTPTLDALTAWPSEILHRPDGGTAGFLMRNMRGTKDIHALYGPKTRLAEFPQADWRMLVRTALNTARAFAALHDTGCLVGDVNHGGVRVAADATVKLIDCDSFQVRANGRTFLCEVGVDNFTPPELQGKSFKITPRTANHDNFGLSILIFQLLMMGRHPYAGRYAGPEEMPIAKAISQFRYAYAKNQSATGMQPPPYTPPVSIASSSIMQLWEQAFGNGGSASSGRPTAKQWVTALSEIEKSFARCSANTAHYYLSGSGACPWCAIERAGITLFLPQNIGVSSTATGNGLTPDALWAQIIAIVSPGPAPAAPKPGNVPPTSSAVQAAQQKRKQTRQVGLGGGIAIFAFGLALRPDLWFLWAAIAFSVARWFAGRGGSASEVQPLRDRYEQARSTYAGLSKSWEQISANNDFDRRLNELKSLHAEFSQLPAQRQKRYQALLQNREAAALQAYLDQFDIEHAAISGIGAAKKAMLESYGIETAADVTMHAVQQVPGFGPKLAQKMMDWRQDIERGFRFNPNTGIDARSLQKLEADITMRQHAIAQSLQQGLADLKKIKSIVTTRRQHLHAALQDAAMELARADADLSVVS
ncbi:protein kinase [Bordetella ansorpii]|uniref:Protein kinase n=1 Tax=Bordetella ansorpii TaxID=288768 RepID=A0A157SGE8_9BORD|nr:hypothetical protein [Bordetella ansorpii]SAI69497.1 protein kinase [Bordetella ansorpii]